MTTLEEIRPRDGSQGQGSAIRVSDVFTTLYLKDMERAEDQTVAQALLTRRGDPEKLTRSEKEKESFPIQAIEAAGAMPRLVILGRPDGGKSTLVNHLATQTAHLRIGADVGQERLPGWPLEEKPLPVRIVLRRFAAWIPADCKKAPKAWSGSTWPHLKELGQYPLLLTLMAQVHGRDGYLPRDRADLYDRAVKLLLVHWDNRLGRDQDGTCKIEQGLIARLGIRTDTLRAALERVALAAHEQQETAAERSGCADIAKEDLRDTFKASLCITGDGAGLLQAEGNRIFRFPHRTFQEYLAAVCIMKKGDFEDYLKDRILRDMAWWQEVFLLAAGSSRATPRNIYQLLVMIRVNNCLRSSGDADLLFSLVLLEN